MLIRFFQGCKSKPPCPEKNEKIGKYFMIFQSVFFSQFSGLINEADIDDWEEMYLQYENYIYPQYDRLFQLYQQYFDEANAAESR